MKKISIITLGAVLATTALVTACSDDFLTQQPASQISIDGYYGSNAHIDEALIAAEDPMHWYDYYNGWAPLFLVTDCQGDDIYVGGGSTNDQREIHLASQYRQSATSTFSGAWTTSYSGLNRSNLVIQDAENSKEISDEQRNYYIAAGKTMRSFYYLILWKFWGNIPYYEKNLTQPYVAPQVGHDTVYQNVTKTLQEVISSKVLPMKETAANAGLPTQAFAEMLYADFVLYQQDKSKYQQALAYMEDIIGSGQYKLMADFAAIWEKSGEWCDESIWEINYCSKGSKRDWGSANAPGGTVVPAMIGVDGLKGSPDYVAGWGFCDVSKEVYDDYEQGDQRRDAGILNMEKYISDQAAKGNKVSYGGRYQNTGLFLRKYLGRFGGNDGAAASHDLGWDNNQRFYRYAETLLNASELAFRLGDQAKAQRYLDLVRDRAGVPHVEVSLNTLLNERRLEFVGEGKRYYDVVRFGKAPELFKAGGGKVLNRDKTAYDVAGIPERTSNWQERYKYLPIPQNEIDVTAKTGFPLKQNPY